MSNSTTHSKIALFSMLILSLYVVCCLHVVSQHVVGLQPVSTTVGVPWKGGKEGIIYGKTALPGRGTREMLIILPVPGNDGESGPC